VQRGSEEVSSEADGEIQPLATDFQISVSTSLIVLAVYTATLHVSVPGGDSGIYLRFLVRPGRGAVYCSQFVCVYVCMSLSVCLSVREHICGIAGPNFTKFFMQVPFGRGSVLLWQYWVTLGYVMYFRFSGPCHVWP